MNSNFNSAELNSVVTVYGLTDLKSVPADLPAVAGMREVRIIIKGEKDRDAGKVSQFCRVPEVTHAYATAFTNSERGMSLVMDYIASLQDKAVRNVYVNVGRSPTSDDLSMNALFELGAAESVTVRLTKETVAAWFEANKASIANFLAVSRGAAIDSIGFWNSDEGMKYLKIAMNYKALIVSLAERKPAFNDDVKAKIELVFASVMSGTVLEEKMLEKLANASMPEVDDLGL